MPASSKKHSTPAAIRAKGVTVRYGTHIVIRDLSFSIDEGAFAAIIGPNGSGKSTLMRALLGLIPYEGRIELLGNVPQRAYGRIGYVPQSFYADPHIPMDVGEFLNLARPSHIPRHSIKEALGEVGLNPTLMQYASLHTLSGGQRQRVLIARAVLCKPDLLFLDEPSAGVDIQGEETLYEILHHIQSDHGTTVVMISHEIDLVVKHVTQVLCLNNCLVCSGPPREALTASAMQKTFGSHYSRHTIKQHSIIHETGELLALQEKKSSM